MRKMLLIFVLAVLLASCASAPTSLPATESPTSTPAETPLPTATQTETITPTPQPTATATLAPENYPNLGDVVLEVQDLSLEPGAYFAYIFIGPDWEPPERRNRPIIQDQTDLLVSQGLCELDCNRRFWFVPGHSISITMIRTENSEAARLLSEDTFQSSSPNTLGQFHYWESPFRDTLPSPETWVIMKDLHTSLLGTTHGSIFMLVEYYADFVGDSYPRVVGIMLNAVNSQIGKLVQAGFSGNP